MADIELVIKISEEQYKFIKEGVSIIIATKYPALMDAICEHISNGKPLPKGHGRLKDIDKIINDGRSKGFCDWYDEMKYADTIIEADTGNYNNEDGWCDTCEYKHLESECIGCAKYDEYDNLITLSHYKKENEE